MSIGSFELISLAVILMNASSTISFWFGIVLWIVCAAIAAASVFFFVKRTLSYLSK
jgi:hypothetical protein